MRPENEINFGLADLGDSDDEENQAEPGPDSFVNREFTRQLSIADAKPEHVHHKRKRLDNMLPDEQIQIWHRKDTSKKSMHKEPL